MIPLRGGVGGHLYFQAAARTLPLGYVTTHIRVIRSNVNILAKMTINTLLQSAYRKIILTFLNLKKKAYNVNTNIVIVIPHLSNEPFRHKAPYPKDAGKIFLVEKDSSVCDGEARSYLQCVT